MAYKLTQSEKEVANFLRGVNKNIENAYRTFGGNSQIYKNLISFVGQIKAPVLQGGSKEYIQVSQSRKALQQLIPQIADIKSRYYKKDGKTIKSVFSTAEQKEITTKIIKKQKKKQGKKLSYKDAYKLKTNVSLIGSLYKDAIDSGVTHDQYEEIYGIMEQVRNDTLTSKDLERLKELSEQEISTHKVTYINGEGMIENRMLYIDDGTGEVLDNLSLDGEWVDIL